MKKPKEKRQFIKRMQACGAASLMTAALLSAGWSAAALQGYTDGRLSVVSEPGEDSPYIRYNEDGREVSSSDMTWVDGGHTGQAVSLSGNGDDLEIPYNQLQMHTMTFSGWFYWRGAAEGQDADSEYKQRLFTLSRSDDIWLSVMPHAKDATRTDGDGKILDGIYMGFAYYSTRLEFWNPAEPDRESYGLPKDEWHFLAVTMDGQNLKLYIDGELWFGKLLVLGVEEMKNNQLTIGGGRWGDPTLNALVDDAAIYSSALTDDQIRMLYAGVDPLAEGASVPATTAPSLPTEPEPTESSSAASRMDEDNSRIFGLPAWTVYLIGGILVVFIGLSVLLSVYQPAGEPSSSGKKSADTGRGDRKDGKRR